MGERRDPRSPLIVSNSKRYIPVRSNIAATKPKSASRIPRPVQTRRKTGPTDQRPSDGSGRVSQQNAAASQATTSQAPTTPPPELAEQQHPPEPPRLSRRHTQRQDIHYMDAPVDVESIIPTRQARPHIAPNNQRHPQLPPIPPPSQQSAPVTDDPLAQPQYEYDWLPEDQQWLSGQLGTAYLTEAMEVVKGKQLRAAKQAMAAGARQNEVLYQMFESGVPFDVIDRFLEEGYEEEEAEQRETEYFEKLERMIAAEADDIDLALTLSRLDIEKHPKREGPLKLDFETDSRGQHHRQKFQRGLRSVQRGIEAMSVLTEEDEPEEVQPELAAAMMYTEECGPGMTNPPNDMFEFLFNQQTVEPIEAGALATQDGGELVPTRAMDIAEQRVERPASREADIRTTQDVPTASVLASGSAGVQAAGTSGARSPASSGARSPGASHPPTPQPSAPPRITRVQPRGGISKRFNLVQMCGSCPPFWFRGYFEAFPHTIGKIAISKSPSMTLQTAWFLMRPENFKLNRRLMIAAV